MKLDNNAGYVLTTFRPLSISVNCIGLLYFCNVYITSTKEIYCNSHLQFDLRTLPLKKNLKLGPNPYERNP